MNTASASGDNVMEMQSQDPNIKESVAVLGTRPARKVKSNRVGWGQLSSRKSRPLTLCYAQGRVLSVGKKKKGSFRGSAKALISNILVPPPPPAPVTYVEGAESFRLLGVPPSADWEEVQAAVTALKEKYAGDTKKLLKIDVAKDKIAELRLRQRVTGTFGVTAEVAEVDKKTSDYESKAFNRAVASKTPKFIIRIPYMWKPFWKIDELFSNRTDRELQRAHTKMSLYYYGGFAACALFFPGSINFIKFGAPLVFVSHLAQRGQPPVPKDGRGGIGAVRDPNYPDYLWAMVFLLTHSLIGGFIGGFLAPFLTFFVPQQVKFIIGVGCMALADAVWQPHVEGDPERWR
jgi:hypothetical protein